MAQERRVLLANGQYITIVQTTGTSSGDVMSQSAVTAALSTKSDTGHTHNASAITGGTFGTARIADGAITTAKIQDKSVTLAKLADNVPIPTTSYEIVKVSGITVSGTIPLGANVTIGGVVYEFDNSGVVSAPIPYGQVYSIKASSVGLWKISNYDATFTAGTPSRSISLTYDIMGVGIEATDGYVYSADFWPSNKTANSIIVASNVAKFRIAVTQPSSTMAISSSYSDPLENYIVGINNSTTVKTDYDGAGNTAKILKMQPSTSYAAGYCNAFTFPDGKTKGFLPSLGQLHLAWQNDAAVNTALRACGGTVLNINSAIGSTTYLSSTFVGVYNGIRSIWTFDFENGNSNNAYINTKIQVRPFANY